MFGWGISKLVFQQYLKKEDIFEGGKKHWKDIFKFLKIISSEKWIMYENEEIFLCSKIVFESVFGKQIVKIEQSYYTAACFKMFLICISY